MSKLDDFQRINRPRAERAIHQLDLIEASAKSMRIHELDIARLLSDVHATLARIDCQDAREAIGAPVSVSKPDPAPEAPHEAQSAPVALYKDRLGDLPNQNLIDMMIACGAILQDRRK